MIVQRRSPGPVSYLKGCIVRNGHVARLAPALMVKDHESGQFQHKLTQGIHAPRMQLLPPAYCKALVGPLNVACGSRPCENADEPSWEQLHVS